MNTTTKTRVLVVDDHALIREGVKSLVNAQPDMVVIGEAADGVEAYAQARELSPDVVVIDVSMPGATGADATRNICAVLPHVRVLALTVHEERAYVRQLLAAGASGYLLKRAVASDLVHAIRVVVRGEVYIDPRLAGALLSSVTRVRESAAAIADLSERETEVLRLIARGYSNKEVAAQLALSVKTVDTYKARSMEKLELHSRADIVRFALQQGWFHSDPPV